MTYRRIQNQDVKGTTDVSVDSDLIHDSKIYVTGGAPAINKRLDQAITDGDIGGGGGGGLGGVNYIENAEFEEDTTGWTLYNDSAAKPDNGQGGTATCTFTRTTTAGEVLSGTGSGKFSHPGGGSKQGEGVAYDLVGWDLKGASKLHEIAFDFLYDGAADQIAVFMIASNDGFTADFNRIEPAANLIQSASGRFSTYFQSLNDTYTDYRLCVHITGTGTAAWDLILESVRVGDYDKIFAPSYTGDWIDAETVGGSWTAGALYQAKYKRIGDTMIGEYVVTASASPPTPNTPLNLDIPDDLNIDTSKVPKGGIFDYNCGSVQLKDASSGEVFQGFATYVTSSTTQIRCRMYEDFGAFESYVNLFPSSPLGLVNGDEIYVQFRVPILEWATPNKSPIAVAQENERVFASGYLSGNQTVTSGSTSDIQFDTVLEDTSNSFNTSNYTYTFPESGIYEILVDFRLVIAGTINSLNLSYIHNGGAIHVCRIPANSSQSQNQRTTTFKGTFNKGDTLKFTMQNSSTGGNCTIVSSSTITKFFISKLSGFNQIIGSETIGARVTQSNGQTVDTNGNQQAITWNNVEYDSIGMFDGTDTFTIEIPGKYIIHGFVTLNTITSNAGHFNQILLKVNGGNRIISVDEVAVTYVNASHKRSMLFGILDLQKGDTVELWGDFLGTAATDTLINDSDYNQMNIFKIGN